MIVAPNPPPPDPAAPPNRILFAEWAPAITPPGRAVKSPDPCLICGAAQNACTAHTPHTPETLMRETKIQGTAAANADPNSNLFVCPDDVVEEYQTGPGTTRPSWRLLHAKGDVIPRERAVALGLVEAPASADTPDRPGPLTMEGHATTVGQTITVPQQ